MKARVDIEIYERWIAEFKGFSSGNFGYRQVDSICAKIGTRPYQSNKELSKNS